MSGLGSAKARCDLMCCSWLEFSVIDFSVILLIFLSMRHSCFMGFPSAAAGGFDCTWSCCGGGRLDSCFYCNSGRVTEVERNEGESDWWKDGLTFKKTNVDLLSKRDHWDWKGLSVALPFSSPLPVPPAPLSQSSGLCITSFLWPHSGLYDEACAF